MSADAPRLPRILVEKTARRLTLFLADAPAMVFPVALGGAPLGPKRAEGDQRTPEGRYFVCTRNEQSRFHLALGLSYPGAADARLALAEGRVDAATAEAICLAEREQRRPPWDTPLGGFIMIHGGGIARGDWTAGCIALEDAAMDALWPLVPLGTEVEIIA